MDAPQPYRTAAICNIVGGGMTIFVNAMWVLSLVFSLVGICLAPAPMVVMGIGAWQVWVGMKMNSGEKVPNAGTVAMVGAISGFLSMSILSAGLGIFAYLQVQDADAKAFLEG